jgi:MFS family permease
MFVSWIIKRELHGYPRTAPRYFYLSLVIIASIVLWYQYFILPSVAQVLMVKFHMSFRFLILALVISSIAGVISAMLGRVTDRIGRCWVVISGVGLVALLQLFGFPNINGKWMFIVLISAVGFCEGIILVATPALVRDFSPQLGRASAMGFWTLGPVAGLLMATEIAAHTLGPSSGDWQGQYIISGVVGLCMFAVALPFLRELSPQIRDQLMVSERDRVLVELRTRGIEIETALKNPWRQMARLDIVVSAIDGSVMLVLFYTAAGAFPNGYFVMVFHEATHGSSLAQANALATWMWGADCIGLLLCGCLSDLFRVRKPFMVFGGLGMMVFILVLISHTGHVSSSYHTVAWICSAMFFFQAMVYSTWMACFTETCEARNPALIATGLSIWASILRFTVAVAFVSLPFVVSSVGTAADNAFRPMTTGNVAAIHDILAGRMPKLSDVDSTGRPTQIANIAPPALTIQNRYPRLVAIVQAHPTVWAQAGTYPGVTLVTKNPRLYSEVLGYLHGSIATLLQIQRISPDLQFLSKYQIPLLRLETTTTTAPPQWEHWLWVCFGCTALFVPFVFVMKGRWRPGRARQDHQKHEALVETELAKIRAEIPRG